MPAKNSHSLTQYPVLSVTVQTAPGQEPEPYTAVNLQGVPSVNARGVVNTTREGAINVVVLGQIPVKVANGTTLTKGQAVSSNSSGQIIAATNTTDILGYSLDAVTAADGQYIEIIVNPVPHVA